MAHEFTCVKCDSKQLTAYLAEMCCDDDRKLWICDECGFERHDIRDMCPCERNERPSSPWKQTTVTNLYFDGTCSFCGRRISPNEEILTQEHLGFKWLFLCDMAIEQPNTK